MPDRRSRARRSALVLVVVAAGAGGAFGGRRALDNVHEVIPGAVYRSAQLSAGRLESVIARDHVRTILNLRGPRPGASWYEAEVGTATRMGVEHIDFELSAIRDVPVPVAEELVRLMGRLPKPLLIHCQAGADRTGLAAALYRYAVKRDASAEAGSELSVLYGHVPVLRDGTAAMDRSYWVYVQAHPRPESSPVPAP